MMLSGALACADLKYILDRSQKLRLRAYESLHDRNSADDVMFYDYNMEDVMV